jgi:pyrroline-5-carboxylate reductase
MPLRDKTIAVIGAGNMGEALIRGLLVSKAIEPHQLVAADVRTHRLDLFSTQFGISVATDNSAAVADADIVLLAVKPQQMASVLAGLREQISPEKLVISIAAGIPTTKIEKELGDSTHVVRVMPNTPAQIGEGAAALCKGQHATDDDLAAADAILSAVGITASTDESLLDAVTALSGTGPAYVFLIAEAMIKAGVQVGLSEELARKLTLQTIIGSAKLLVQSGEDPAELRHKVTSPNGTTEAAMKVMAEGRLVDVFLDAIKAAATRSGELSGS